MSIAVTLLNFNAKTTNIIITIYFLEKRVVLNVGDGSFTLIWFFAQELWGKREQENIR